MSEFRVLAGFDEWLDLKSAVAGFWARIGLLWIATGAQ
jgi:hypothetical protein